MGVGGVNLPRNGPARPPWAIFAGVALPDPLQSFDDAAAELATLLHEVDQAAGRLRTARAAGRVSANTIEAVRVGMTYDSNAIEGSTLSLRDTQLVIEGKSPAAGKELREIYEARNHDRALRMVERWATERPGLPATEADLLGVHAVVMADIDAGAGRYRSDRVRIVGTNFIPPSGHKFDALIPAALGRAGRQEPHPVLRAAELHYNLVAIHPFNDGNGRTGRLMMNDYLLRHGYPYGLIKVEQRGTYLAALDHANHGRVWALAEFVARCVLRGADELLID